MRLLLAGPRAATLRLREQLRETAIDIVGDYASIADARASGADADAILIPTVADGVTGSDNVADALEEHLTPREVEVLQLLAEGLPNKAIAHRLDISDQTVKFHVSSVIAKIGAANRTDAVRRGVRRGLISL